MSTIITKYRLYIFTLSIILVILGYIYFTNLFGFTSYDAIPTIINWGKISIFLGITFFIFSILDLIFAKSYLNLLQNIVLIFIILHQILPSFAWIFFHGKTAGEYSEKVYGNYLLSLPHICIFIMCLLYYKFKKQEIR